MTAEQDKHGDTIMNRGQDIQQGLKLAFYFRYNRIYIGKKTMQVLGMPDYVHLLINEKEKWLFIKSCEKDKNAFNVYFTCGEDSDNMQYLINEKPLLKWLARIMGVEGMADTVQFSGLYIPDDEAVFFNMKRYSVMSHDEADS